MNVQKKDGEATPLLHVPSVLKERWHIVRKLGGGGFGEIYEGRVAETGETCAVKVESSATSKQVLKMEAAVLRRLQSANCEHACQFLGAGRTDTINFVVMSLLGPNLSELRKKQPHGKFSWATTFRLAMQMIVGVQAVHDCGFLHRDIKPSNFVMGSQPNTKHTCYILDFGLARQYVTATGEVREPRATAGFRGTVRYASINAHRAIELGRHDDLWSLFYLLMEFLHGQLPWRRLKEKEEVAKVKEEFNHNEFLVGLPVEFEMILSHLQRLDYYTCPDYSLLINLFEAMIHRYGIPSDGPMDWEIDAVADNAPSSSVVSPAAHRDAVMEDGVDGADENGQLALADRKAALLNEQIDATNKTHCSGQENFSGGGECDRDDHPSRNRDIMNASVEIVVSGRASPERRDVCDGEAEVGEEASLSGEERNGGSGHSQASLVRKSESVIEVASVEKGDSSKGGPGEEKSDDAGVGGDKCGDIDEVIHLVTSSHELVVNGDEQETGGDNVRVASQSAGQFLNVLEDDAKEEEGEEEEEGAVYPELVGVTGGYKARESAFDAAFSATAVTNGEQDEAGAACWAVVNVSVGEGGVVGSKSESGSCGAKELHDEESCEVNGSKDCDAVLDGKVGSSEVNEGSSIRSDDGSCACDDVDGSCQGGSDEGDGVSSEDDDGGSAKGDGGSGEGDDNSLQERLLQVLAENDTSHLAPFATTDSLPPLPTDYDHILRDSQWTVTSVGVDQMGTLQLGTMQLLRDGSKMACIDSSSKAEEHPEKEHGSCVEKVVSGSSQMQSFVAHDKQHTDEEQRGEELALRATEADNVYKEPCDDGLGYNSGPGEVVVSNRGTPCSGSDGGDNVKGNVFAGGYSGDEFDEVVSVLEDGSSESEGGTSPQAADSENHETGEVAVVVDSIVGQVEAPVDVRHPEETHGNSELAQEESPPPSEDVPATASVNSAEPVALLLPHGKLPSTSLATVQKLLGISGLDPFEPVSLPCFPATGIRPQVRDPRWKRFNTITSNT